MVISLRFSTKTWEFGNFFEIKLITSVFVIIIVFINPYKNVSTNPSSINVL